LTSADGGRQKSMLAVNSPRARRARRDGAFTLVELMVVVLVIAILLAIAIPMFLGARVRSQDAVAKTSLRTALEVQRTAGFGATALTTPAQMAAEDASLQYTVGVSGGPRSVSMSGSSTASVFAARSASGTCWAVSATALQPDIIATSTSSCRGSTLSLLSLNPSGQINTVAGTGVSAVTGDGGLAIAAAVASPLYLATAADDSILIAERDAHVIRKVSPDGTISTVAGTGVVGFSPDGTLAIAANINIARGLALAPDGSIYFSEAGNNRIRKIAPSGILSTVIGDGTASSTGDGFAATAGTVHYPNDLVLRGNTLFFSSEFSYRIRQVNLTTGIVSAFAGTGVSGFSGDGGPALSAQFGTVYHMVDDGLGNLYVSDFTANRIRKIDAGAIVTTFAGNGSVGDSGDGGLAASASLGHPRGLTIVGSSLYVIQAGEERIRRISGGVISTVSGSGVTGFSGDGGPALQAASNWGIGLTHDSAGNLYFADFLNHRVRRINA
jgi:prepilin-type N-terminal cleavage/methylation domain-containing protein